MTTTELYDTEVFQENSASAKQKRRRRKKHSSSSRKFYNHQEEIKTAHGRFTVMTDGRNINLLKEQRLFEQATIDIPIPKSTDWIVGVIKSNKRSYKALSTETLKDKFEKLTINWKKETLLTSNINEIIMHPDYQKIISLGMGVIPLILNEMTKEHGHWFWALNILTGEDPVPLHDSGNISKMTKHWLDWGKRNGYSFPR